MNTIVVTIIVALLAGFLVWILMRQLLSEIRERLRQKEEEAANMTSELMCANRDKAALEAELKTKEESWEARIKEREAMMGKYMEELNQMRATMQTEFQAVASKILDEKSAKFTELNRTQVETILNPLKMQLGDFRTRIDTVYKTESDDRASLKAQIEQLRELNSKITDEAHALTKALKGNSQARGAWGELILERLLEAAGLRKDEEYFVQTNITMGDGSRLRPDVVLRLPDDRHLVVDSKCSLIAYEQAVNAKDEAERKSAIVIHVKAVRQHIEELAGKAYEDTGKLFTPDYVLMFVPIEPAFIMALEADLTLYDWALERKVVLCTAPTLLVTLKTAAMLWKQDRQSKNLMEIVNRGGALYDKFVGLYEDIQKIGDALKKTQTCYDGAVNKLKEGRGNLLRQVEDLKSLGAKASKSLPAADLLAE
jgi:DNA recombination protein RmuC